MKRLFAVLLMALCLVSIPVSGEGFDSDDIFDAVTRYGIPTVETVNTLKANADALFSAGNYSKACHIYQEAADRADFLAKIMIRCIEPYYNDTSDSKSLPDTISDDLIALESKANELILLRNVCYVYNGICYSRDFTNEYGKQNGFIQLLNSLSLIESSQKDIWSLAVREIMNIINFH